MVVCALPTQEYQMARCRFNNGIATVILTIFVLLEVPSSALVQPGRKSPWHRQLKRKCGFQSTLPPQKVNVLHESANFVDAPQRHRDQIQKKHKHTLAILTMPHSTSARIANEAILNTAISVTTNRLSVVVRTNTGGSDSMTGEGFSDISLTQLRKYVGEIFRLDLILHIA